MGPQDLLTSSREELERVYNEVIATGTAGVTTESPARYKDGRMSVAELQRRALRSGDGWIIVSISRAPGSAPAEQGIEHLVLETHLRRALEREELFLHSVPSSAPSRRREGHRGHRGDHRDGPQPEPYDRRRRR